MAARKPLKLSLTARLKQALQGTMSNDTTLELPMSTTDGALSWQALEGALPVSERVGLAFFQHR